MIPVASFVASSKITSQAVASSKPAPRKSWSQACRKVSRGVVSYPHTPTGLRRSAEVRGAPYDQKPWAGKTSSVNESGPSAALVVEPRSHFEFPLSVTGPCLPKCSGVQSRGVTPALRPVLPCLLRFASPSSGREIRLREPEHPRNRAIAYRQSLSAAHSALRPVPLPPSEFNPCP